MNDKDGQINLEITETRFKVSGAGELIIGAEPGHIYSCGTSRGIHVGATWGEHGEVGGAIDRKEVKKLIKYLQDWYKYK